ncbi:MAG: cation transporter [Saprospiraceae bacterium]|nr:cation transporter [Saprospiraceae bacterium]MBX7180263.1 cation transporter [Saprospiraceae bacterium]MCB0590241.1 cation transporter [Saprospiraceae bacterium]MCO5282085.1 cation transporter [Saprospiraceae bacterium]MCO6470983.1 cation transporter [Saprospiraceae bacterium]
MKVLNLFAIILLITTSSFANTNENTDSGVSTKENYIHTMSHHGDVISNPPGNITTTFKVAGNCGMCKKRIEAAAKSVKGVKAANWDGITEMITITYNEQKTDLMEVHKKIAAAGYDTELVQATDESYNSLHGCCHYDRLQYDKKEE